MKKKYLAITVVSIFLFTIFLSGCTQNNNDGREVSHKVEIVWHDVQTGGTPPYDFMEVVGQIKNNDTKDYDKVEIIVGFFDKNDNMIHFGAYNVYSLLQNYSADFFVHYSYTDPNYTDYDHYEIRLKVE